MERVTRFYGVLAGVGIFFGVAVACVGGEAADMAAAPESSPELLEAEPRTTALKARIATLEMEVQAVNKSRETFKAEAELKINDLLDAIETDKTRQAEAEVQWQAATDALVAQKASAAEISAGLQRQIDEVKAQLAVRDQEMEQALGRVDRASLELALDEVERLEKELAAGEAAAVQQHALLLKQIETLQKQAVEAGESLATARRELEQERRLRFELEARSQAQAKAIEETGAMLAEARAALARQYDAIRRQLQAGVTMRLEEGVTEGEAGGKAEPLVTLSPDLVPLIGRLETATATAMADVTALREQLERERALLAVSVVEKDAKLSAERAEMVAMQQRVQAISEEASARAAEMEAAHAAALAATADAHELRIAGLKGEIEGLKKAMESRDRTIGMLEEDLKAGRDNTARVLDEARETEATLASRIRELETAFALPDTESAATDASDKASLRDTVSGSILDRLTGPEAISPPEEK